MQNVAEEIQEVFSLQQLPIKKCLINFSCNDILDGVSVSVKCNDSCFNMQGIKNNLGTSTLNSLPRYLEY